MVTLTIYNELNEDCTVEYWTRGSVIYFWGDSVSAHTKKDSTCPATWYDAWLYITRDGVKQKRLYQTYGAGSVSLKALFGPDTTSLNAEVQLPSTETNALKDSHTAAQILDKACLKVYLEAGGKEDDDLPRIVQLGEDKNLSQVPV